MRHLWTTTVMVVLGIATIVRSDGAGPTDARHQAPASSQRFVLHEIEVKQVRDRVAHWEKRGVHPTAILHELMKNRLTECSRYNEVLRDVAERILPTHFSEDEMRSLPSRARTIRERLLPTAIARQHREVAKTLIQKSAPIESTYLHRTSLLWAAVHGDQEIAEQLIAIGADPSNRGGTRTTPVQAAYGFGWEGLGDRLAELTGESARDYLNVNLLARAVFIGDVEKASALLRRGTRVDTEIGGGMYPLCLAVTRGDLEMVKILLEYGAATNIGCGGRWAGAPLSQVAREEHDSSAPGTERRKVYGEILQLLGLSEVESRE